MRKTKIDHQAVIKWIKDGATIQQAARHFNISECTVQDLCKQYLPEGWLKERRKGRLREIVFRRMYDKKLKRTRPHGYYDSFIDPLGS